MVLPDITGKGQLAYKGPASAQLAVLIKNKVVGGKKVLERYVSTIRSGEHETKNRWELSLDAEEEAHFGKMFKKIKAA